MRPPFNEINRSEAARHGICDYLYTEACISSEGKLNPCIFPVMPQIRITEKFKKSWNSSEMIHVRMKHDSSEGPPLCRECYLILEGRDSVINRRNQFLKGDALESCSIINFSKEGNADDYKLSGWSETEQGFTWTDGIFAGLVIKILATYAPFVYLSANLSAFLIPGKVDRQMINIIINGHPIGIWLIKEPGLQQRTLAVPNTLFKNTDRMEIRFHIPDAASPYQFGLNDDRRLLGFAVQTIELSNCQSIGNR